MSNRWLRFVIALLAIGAAGAAGYRIYQQEHRLSAALDAARAADLAAETAIVTISELKAAMHAYVAEGQGDAFWTARASTLLDRLRASLLELETPAVAAGATLTETLDLADQLAAAEQRAREHVRSEQRLMAGDVIFTEARDLLDALRMQVSSARTALSSTTQTTQGNVRREQATLALAAVGILAFATLLLVIPGGGPAPTDSPVTSISPSRIDEATSTAGAPGSRAVSGARPGMSKASAPAVHTATAAATAPSAPGTRSAQVPAISLKDAAAVCTDLGRASQTVEITNLLARAAQVLNATGAIVWMASTDGREMYPAASAGYDDRLIARIGAIRRDANNVTAAALRDAAARTSPAAAQSAAALAVPLLTPLGPVGVFSAEVKDVATVDDTRLAIATIFAAQLATLLGSMAPAAALETAGETSQTANA